MTAVDAYDGSSSITTFNVSIGASYNYSDSTATAPDNTTAALDNDVTTGTDTNSVARFVYRFPTQPDYLTIVYGSNPAYAITVAVPNPTGVCNGREFRVQGGSTWSIVHATDIENTLTDSICNTVLDSSSTPPGDGYYWDLIGGSLYETTNGTIVTDILDNTTSLYNITFIAPDYLPNTTYDTNLSSGTSSGQLAQSITTYDSCLEKYTNSSLNCSEPGPFYFQEGNVTVDVNVSDYYSISKTTEILPRTINSVETIGFYDFILNVSVNDYTGNTEENFDITLTNTNLSINLSSNSNLTGPCGCNSTAVFFLLSGYTYEVEVNATSTIYDDPVNQNGFANITNTTAPRQQLDYLFNLSAARQVNLNYYWEENLTTFSKNVTAFFIPTDDFNSQFFTTTSTNGSDTIFNIPVGSYIVELVVEPEEVDGPPGLGGDSGGYHAEERFIILTPLVGNNITGYFRENTTGEHKTFTVSDDRGIIQNGWVIRAQRYYNSTGWITVDEGRSNIDGTTDINLLSDEYYRLVLLDEELDVRFTSDRTELPESAYSISASTSGTTYPFVNETLGVSGLLRVEEHANGTKYFAGEVSSTAGERNWLLQVYRQYSNGQVLVAEESLTATGGTITADLPNASGTYRARLILVGSEIGLWDMTYTIGGFKDAIGSGGAAYAVFIFLGIIGVGIFSAPAGIILGIIGLVVAAIVGLFNVGWSAIAALIIVGGLIIYRRDRP